MDRSELTTLDDLISNIIKNGTITDIFGFRGTGKTQMSLQIALNPLTNGKKVLFIDTTAEFRPERFLQIIKNRNLDDTLLNQLQVARITNTTEQIELTDKIKKLDDVMLVIVDNVTDLFSFEYSKKEQFNLQQKKFMNYMHNLSQLAIHKEIPIVITNQLMTANNTEYEKMSSSISNYTHQKIKLEKQKNHYKGIIMSAFSKKTEFFYKIEKMGLIQRS